MCSDTIVYSAVTSSYDMVFKPRVLTENVQYVLFSDRPGKIKGWNVLPISNVIKGNKSLTNRWYKFFPHEVFKKAEYSVYVDGNIRITGDLAPLIQEFKESGAALGVFTHQDRTNIFQEADACVEFGKFDERDKQRVKEQLKIYTESGMPLDQPLTDNGIIFRWHQHPRLVKAMSSWWEQLQSFSKRDQISLPYIIWQTNLPVKMWSKSFREESAYFEVYRHRQTLIRDLITLIRVYRNDNKWSRYAYSVISCVRCFFR